MRGRRHLGASCCSPWAAPAPSAAAAVCLPRVADRLPLAAWAARAQSRVWPSLAFRSARASYFSPPVLPRGVRREGALEGGPVWRSGIRQRCARGALPPPRVAGETSNGVSGGRLLRRGSSRAQRSAPAARRRAASDGTARCTRPSRWRRARGGGWRATRPSRCWAASPVPRGRCETRPFCSPT